MDRKQLFKEVIDGGYAFKGDSIVLGTAILDNDVLPQTLIRVPLGTMNRHGLIAGATGTGKTKTLQVICEQLSDSGVSVLIMDIKGDVSGMAMPGVTNEKIEERMAKIGKPWVSKNYPVELMSISHEKGIAMRATVSEFGPVLFSKILELNDTQQGVVALVFKYCDTHNFPLLDLKDFRKALHYLTNEGKKEIAEQYGQISPASAGTILRKIVELESQGAELFFGERSFDVEDLVRTNDKGQGYINVLRLADIQSRPKLFSTFMLCLLAEVYNNFEELGDKVMPKLVIVVDEAHLIFKEASKALLEQLETIIKLIRSKGVGVFFCTQLPTDIPPNILSQLGLKVQHALRAFTANDRKVIKLTSENYPLTDFYKTDELLTSLGIGEAIVTALNEKGIPTPLAHTLLVAPQSRMDVLTAEELDTVYKNSALRYKYEDAIDRESAYELLNKKMQEAAVTQAEEKASTAQRQPPAGRKPASPKTILDKTTQRQLVNTVARGIVREIFGVMKRR